MKKRLLFAAIAAALLVTMTACGSTTVTPETEINQAGAPEEELNWLDGQSDSETQMTGSTTSGVPTPPEAKDYLPTLWSQYDCTQFMVDVNGNQATYLIHVTENDKLVDSIRRYQLVLEYDSALDNWIKVSENWLDGKYTFNESELKATDWIIRPKTGSDGIVIRFHSITSSSCTISWDAIDSDITLDGKSSGQATFSMEQGGINGNSEYPCWVLDGAEIVFNWNYYGGDYKECKYYIQIQPDEVAAPMDDPFSNTTGNGVVHRYNG